LAPIPTAQAHFVPSQCRVGRQQAAFYETHSQIDLFAYNKLSGRTQALSDLKGWLLDCYA